MKEFTGWMGITRSGRPYDFYIYSNRANCQISCDDINKHFPEQEAIPRRVRVIVEGEK